jgi:hypothetical protein
MKRRKNNENKLVAKAAMALAKHVLAEAEKI